MEVVKWYTITEWVDVDTGEVIPTINKHYFIKTKLLNTTYKITNNGNENIGHRINTYGCRFNGQLSIEFDQPGTSREHTIHADNDRRREFLRDGIVSNHRNLSYKR